MTVTPEAAGSSPVDPANYLQVRRFHCSADRIDLREQIVRTLTMAHDGGVDTPTMLICDRDRKWSAAVRRRLEQAGLRVLLTPERAPNANAYAERFVRSIKEECLDRLIPIGEQHFRRAVAEYVTHYHGERNHQGLDNRLISGP